MINLSKLEMETLHCKHGSRVESYAAELLDGKGVKKCDIDLIDGNISFYSDIPIKRAGSIVFKEPNAYRKIESGGGGTTTILMSESGKKYELGIETTGRLWVDIAKDDPKTVNSVTVIKVADNGRLYIDTTVSDTTCYELLDKDGYTWIIGVCDKRIYTQRSDIDRKVYYINQKIDINYVNDRVKLYMCVSINNEIVRYSLGVFLMSNPITKKGIINCQLFDETIVVSSGRILSPKLFVKGTLYTDVLQYFIISCGIIKLNIESSKLTIQTDMFFDDSKTKLEWFNYVAEQINYTQLTVDENGWFVSRKYVEPSPSKVDYVYEDNYLSVICGEADVVLDNYRIPNIFKIIVSHPSLGELVSIYINDDPTDLFSTANTYELIDRVIVDNVASQIELDVLTKKAAFKAKQVMQTVMFETLNMPFHKENMILDIRHSELTGIFLESSFSITLKAGSKMKHTCKRLIPLPEK